MKQEDKELLLRDLCARLPYGVKVKFNNIHVLRLGTHTRVGEYVTDVTEPCKPYLFPLSSMTEKQKIECFEETDIELDECNEIWSKFSSDTNTVITSLHNWLKVIDWLNKHHFDYRGLIEKGLAIDCTTLNIY